MRLRHPELVRRHGVAGLPFCFLASLMPRALVAVTNDLATDQRVHRTCTVLGELGYEVLLIGRRLPGSLPLERSYATRRMWLLFNTGALFYAEYNLRLWLRLLFTRAQLIVANDLDTLPACWMAQGARRLVYDTHEFYTEVPELVGRPRVRAVWLWIERRIFPSLRTVITVNQSIANAYEERYVQLRSKVIVRRAHHDRVEGDDMVRRAHHDKWVQVVRNIPMKRELALAPTRVQLDLPIDRFILVLQGAGINVQRGGEEAVLAMKDLPGALLLIIGGGDAWPVLERMVKEHCLADRVRMLGKMPYERMMDFTRNADLGLTLDKDTNLNYRFSLPNKVFDYMQAGIPVLATDLPEVAAVVREHDAGVVIAQADPVLIGAAVKALMDDPRRLATLKRNATFAALALDGEGEKEKLKALLKRTDLQ